MSAHQQRGETGVKGSARARRGGKSRRSTTSARPNRAQLRALEARATSTSPPVTNDEPLASSDRIRMPGIGQTNDTSGPPARRRLALARPVARPVALTRDEEYQFIRVDLRRLLVAGGSLLVAMIALLVVLGG